MMGIIPKSFFVSLSSLIKSAKIILSYSPEAIVYLDFNEFSELTH